jgi:sulfate permease, SulP family
MTHGLHRFRPRLAGLRHEGYGQERFARDLGAGITVGVVALPLAMAFAIASGLPPEAGLASAIIGGLIVSALGGSSVQIGGPAGAFIVVVYTIVERYGLANLLISTMLAGVLLMLLGLFRLGGLVRFVPVSVVIGFTNGIAVLIALSQIKDLLGLPIAKMPADFFSQIGALASQVQHTNFWALGMGLACFGGLMLWPRLWADRSPLRAALSGTRAAHTVGLLPGPVVALVTMSLAAAWLALPLETIGSRFGGIPSGLPAFALPEFSWATVKQLAAPTLAIAFLGGVESLLCARVADKLSTTARHDPNQELMAQGLANLVVPFFGGLPVTGTMARTVTNIRSGASSPVAGISHALVLLAIVLAAAPLAVHVPLAALAGILLFVAWNMGEWREFARLRQYALPYRITLLSTFGITVVFDLMLAVEVGLMLACIFFIWRMATEFRVQVQPALAGQPPEVQVAGLHGSLFFGSAAAVEDLPQQLAPGTRLLVLDAHRLVLMDSSGAEALHQLQLQLSRRGVALALARVQGRPLDLLHRSGLAAELGPSGLLDGVAAAWETKTAAEAAQGPPN